jgi:alpha-N-arabinofuranosidase
MKTYKYIWSIFLVILVSCTAEQEKENKIIVKTAEGKDTISRHIYGHFTEHLGRCIYGGIWVGRDSPIPNTRGIRNDIVDALQEINIPNIRWPGGCYAETYHWMDGIGDPENRPKFTNTSWGGELEDNSFGTHEFMDLCEQLGCEPVFCGNVASGTVKEMADWVEYLTSDLETPMVKLRKKNGREKPWKVQYWGVGNENWGCGGIMTKEYYASQFAKYSNNLKNYGNNRLFKIATGGNGNNYEWTEYIVKRWSEADWYLKDYLHAVSLHHYTICHNWTVKGSATDFNEDDWFSSLSRTLVMDTLISGHVAAIDKYDHEKKIGLVIDEWGNWFDPEPGTNPSFHYQQSTLRDALVTSVNFDIFNKHCSRVKMTNIAQMVNVIQSLILTREEQMVLTPTYYVFKMYKVHHDALMLPLEITCRDYTSNNKSIPAISASSSMNKEGNINITLSNLDPVNQQDTKIIIEGDGEYDVVNAEIITAERMNMYNDFGKEEEINIKKFEDFEITESDVNVKLPSKSVVLITLEKK